MKRTSAQRLRAARAKAGYKTASAFADAHGITASAYRHKENGNRRITVEDAKLYAHYLSLSGQPISWQDILDDDIVSPNYAFLGGYVGAGEAIIPFHHEDSIDHDPIPAPPDISNAQAFVVRGDSMLPVYRNGDVLFVGSRTVTIAEAAGHDCLVQVTDGARLIKAVRRGRKKGHLRLYSYGSDTESDDVRVDWAAPVRWVKRAI